MPAPYPPNPQGRNQANVEIKVTKGGAPPRQDAQQQAGGTRLLQRVLNKNPQTTVVVIDEVETDNWGIGGETVTVRRAREKG